MSDDFTNFTEHFFRETKDLERVKVLFAKSRNEDTLEISGAVSELIGDLISLCWEHDVSRKPLVLAGRRLQKYFFGNLVECFRYLVKEGFRIIRWFQERK